MDSITEEENGGEEQNTEEASSCARMGGDHEDGSSNGFTMAAAAVEAVEATENGSCRQVDEAAVSLAASVVVRGVLFSRSIRSTYACLHLYPLLEDDDDSSSTSDNEDGDGDDEKNHHLHLAKPLLVRLQFVDQKSLSTLRSHIRRFCKMGDLLFITQPQQQQAVAPSAEIQSTLASNDTSSSTTLTSTAGGQQQQDRVILHITSVLEASSHVKVEQYQYWKMGRVQEVQAAFRQFLVGESSPHYKNSHIKPKKKMMKLTPAGQQGPKFAGSSEDCCCCCSGHGGGGGLEKRKLAQYMVNFLVHMTMNQIAKEPQVPVNYCYSEEYAPLEPSQWATTCPWQAAPHELVLAAIEQLNSKRTRRTTTASSSSTAKEANACSSSASDVTTGDEMTTTTTTTTDDTAGCGGVLDVAGGSGLVSMALGMLFGVRATVVDPRSNVGKLPKRDRKVYQRALSKGHTSRRSSSAKSGTDHGKKFDNNNKSNSNGDDRSGQTTTGAKQQQQQQQQHSGDFWSSFPLYCQPIQFDTRQAWFGQRLLTATIDDDPHQQQAQAPSAVVGRQLPSNGEHEDDESDSDLLSSCSAIVALHPDQATDSVVEVALRHEISFVVVPCCVFSRLFPHRRRPTPVRRTDNGAGAGDEQEQEQQPVNLSVNTRLELLDYLQAKDDRIQRVDMPFIGANTVLWCTF